MTLEPVVTTAAAHIQAVLSCIISVETAAIMIVRAVTAVTAAGIATASAVVSVTTVVATATVVAAVITAATASVGAEKQSIYKIAETAAV